MISRAPNEISRGIRTASALNNNLRLRFRGCMLGAAIGDSMGMATETFSRQKIQRQFGHVQDLLPHKTKNGEKPAGSWTDDTYLTMLTTKSVLEKGAIDIPHMTSLFIDGLNYDEFGIAGTTRRALELRAAGQDITSLDKGRHGGAGPSSRIAPIALLCFRDLGLVRENAIKISRITHLDGDAVAGAVSVAMTIAWALRGELNTSRLLNDLRTLTLEMNSNLFYNFGLAMVLLEKGADTLEGIDEIGADGASVRLVPSAIFAFLKHPTNFADAILSSVNAGGDTDTRAAIVGAISGAFNTANAIPQKWINKLENNSVVIDYAERLHDVACADGPEGD